MECQQRKAVIHAGCIKEGEDTAEKTEVHEESKKDAAYSGGIAPWENKADVHGDAA